MSIRNGLVFAMEDDNLVEGGDQSMVPETAAGVEAGAAQVAEQSGEVEELQAAVEDAVDGAETLGQVEEVLEKTAESGDGVDETAAQVAEIAVESIKNRLGIIGGKHFPAMESFGSKNTRLSATKVALENVRETIARIWESIKSAIVRMWEKIKSFFIGLIKNTGMLITHLETLQERVKKIPENAKPSKNDLDNSSLAKAFSVNKKADISTAKTIVTNAGKLLGIAGKISQASGSFSAAIQTAAENASVAGSYEKARADLGVAVEAAIKTVSLIAGTHGGGVKDKETAITYYGPFAGTRVLAVKNETKNIDGETYREFGISITTYEKIEATSITALKRDEIFGLLKDGLQLLDGLKDFEKTEKDLQKVADNVKSSADKATSSLNKAASDADDTAKSRALRAIAADVANLNQITGSLGTSLPAAVFATGKAVGDYASASIANLKSDK